MSNKLIINLQTSVNTEDEVRPVLFGAIEIAKAANEKLWISLYRKGMNIYPDSCIDDLMDIWRLTNENERWQDIITDLQRELKASKQAQTINL